MKSRSLKVVDVSRNYSIGAAGLTSIIYNLAFSAMLQTLDFSGCICNPENGYVQLQESLTKLLLISSSI